MRPRATLKCMPYENLVTTRATLFDRVWAAPMRRIAPEFGVTDVGLKKICRRLGILTPPQGYWLRAPENRGARPHLPPPPAGVDEEIQFRKWAGAPPEPPAVPKRPPELEARMAKEAEPSSKIVVPDHLARPHPLVVALRDRMRETTPYEDGFLYLEDGRDVDVHVSKAQSRRALRLLDTLFKALEARGAPVTVAGRPPLRQGWPPDHEREPKSTRARIDGEWVSLRLTERTRFGVPDGTHPPAHLKGERLRDWEFIYIRKRRLPAGHFRLQACAGWLEKDWPEVPGGFLEERLNEVVAGLFLLTHSWKELREHRRLEEIRRAQEEEERRQQEVLREQERKRVQHLLELASRWGEVRKAAGFLRAVRAEIRRAPNKRVRSELEARLAWAEATLKEMDPVSEFLESDWD